MRDCSRRVVQPLTKSPQERFRALRALDNSKSGRWQFLVRSEISPVSYRVSDASGNHDQNHPTRRQASRPGSRNRGCRDRLDADAGICNLQIFGFGGCAREYVHNRLRFYADTGGETFKIFSKRMFAVRREFYPSPQSSPRKQGEAEPCRPNEMIKAQLIKLRRAVSKREDLLGAAQLVAA